MVRRNTPVATLAAAAALSACAPVTTLEGDRLAIASPEFAAYVERVFREQNALATEIVFEMESHALDSPRYGALASAETDLLEACAGLNELANERRTGRGSRGPGAARRARTAVDCERAVAAVADVLEAAEP